MPVRKIRQQNKTLAQFACLLLKWSTTRGSQRYGIRSTVIVYVAPPSPALSQPLQTADAIHNVDELTRPQSQSIVSSLIWTSVICSINNKNWLRLLPYWVKSLVTKLSKNIFTDFIQGFLMSEQNNISWAILFECSKMRESLYRIVIEQVPIRAKKQQQNFKGHNLITVWCIFTGLGMQYLCIDLIPYYSNGSSSMHIVTTRAKIETLLNNLCIAWWIFTEHSICALTSFPLMYVETQFETPLSSPWPTWWIFTFLAGAMLPLGQMLGYKPVNSPNIHSTSVLGHSLHGLGGPCNSIDMYIRFDLAVPLIEYSRWSGNKCNGYSNFHSDIYQMQALFCVWNMIILKLPIEIKTYCGWFVVSCELPSVHSSYMINWDWVIY